MKRTFAVLLMLLLGSVPAWAVLGENVSTVSSDVQVLRGQHVMVAKTGYNLHQITMKDGSVVNEFVSPAGIVFGISWQSHFMPNLQQLLGSHMIDLQQGPRQTVRRRLLIVRTDKFVFVSSGHMRVFQGHAYVPSLIPSNLGPEVVQ